jgi:small-conductance mechanosensitive channel
MRRFLILLVLCFVTGIAAWGQNSGSSGPQDASLPELEELTIGLEGAEQRLAELREALKAAQTAEVTEGELLDIRESVAKQRALVETLRDNLLCAASGIEEDYFEGESQPAPTLQESLEDIIEPISRAMREVTEGPRALDKLKSDLEDWKSRLELVNRAQVRIDELLMEAEEGSDLREELEGFKELWKNRKAEAKSQVQVFSHQLKERNESTPTGWDAISMGIADFWRSRGMNLLIAIVSSVLVFVLIRWGYNKLVHFSPLHRGKRGFGARAVDLAVALLSVVLAIFAAVLVFYLRGDWLLLAVAVLMLVGIAWASKQAIPPYLEQLKLILNLGSVRQGERVVYEGVPWRVDRLAFYCEFRNPQLDGGNLRLPVQEVLSLHSRESETKEPWFPTKENDWVVLADETYGKVVQQTPEQVIVLRLGGSRKTYPTTSFLEAYPENLSQGFRISTMFGVDYDLQAISTTDVPEGFRVRIEKALCSKFDHVDVRSVQVELAGAGASSLDYEIITDFSGELASRVNVLKRLIQKTCVEVCNEQGWGIPFTQITVHQAED